MKPSVSKINTIIIDDDPFAIKTLVNMLSDFEEIRIIDTATTYPAAKKTILDNQPDLLFLDIEMPNKTGFELLTEIQVDIEKPLGVVFCTGYEKYTIQALRESAIDYLLKPVSKEELRAALNRFRMKNKNDERNAVRYLAETINDDIITLPTSTGIKFLKRNEIVLVKYQREKGWTKSYWYVLLYNEEILRLRSGVNAITIMQLFGEKHFLHINQSAIVNLSYLNTIEIKTRQCILLPPFDRYHFCVSRNCMTHIRERFDAL
ncbi:LytR/AlgR family response regulator transcription factor [Saccharicrinis sp. FJH54]|uniref:LytR/AlgR family response regulator transcription factor n=1 Tax=Saccharicrinis sp. FJH54 TaxID=3344665 RepID=UPI0035D3FA89